MKLCFDSLKNLSEYVKDNNSPIVIYGAGMIGSVIMPYFIMNYDLLDKLLFYVDNDTKKQEISATTMK